MRELYRDELVALLSRHFRIVRLYGQRLMFHSVLWSLAGGRGQALSQVALADGRFDIDAPGAPLYYLAVCAQQESDLPPLPPLALFSDAAQSVYEHYQHEIRKNMQVGALLAERDAALAQTRQALAQAEARIDTLQAERTPRWRYWPFGRK